MAAPDIEKDLAVAVAPQILGTNLEAMLFDERVGNGLVFVRHIGAGLVRSFVFHAWKHIARPEQFDSVFGRVCLGRADFLHEHLECFIRVTAIE